MESSLVDARTPRLSRKRRWAFRAAAVGLSLLALAAVEFALRLLGVGRPDAHTDPYAGFRDVLPLFVLDEATQRYEIPLARQTFFRPESFPARKPPGEFRAFVLGGSTVQGNPFAIETSFTTWLELSLCAAEPRRTFDVVNCGGVSYASYRLTPIVEQILAYQPDLVILCTGHNEFLEDRAYEHLRRRPRAWAVVEGCAAKLHLFHALRAGWQRVAGAPSATGAARPLLPTEVDAILDEPGSLVEYRRDDAWRGDVVAHYRHNVARMIALCQQAGAPVLVMNPVENLRDCPPFKVEPSENLSADEQRRFDQLLAEAARRNRTNRAEAVESLLNAVRIDPRRADAWYELAANHDALGEYDQARAAYIRAKEEDVCPLRMTEPLHEALLDVAEESAAPVVDVRKLFDSLADAGIPGGDLLIDHVHPTIHGHQLIAAELMLRLAELGFVAPRDGWEARRDATYASHTASLDDLYYLHGEQRLRNLRLWTQGRAGPRLRKTAPAQ